jgi:autotransporter-associated beta strand protein
VIFAQWQLCPRLLSKAVLTGENGKSFAPPTEMRICIVVATLLCLPTMGLTQGWIHGSGQGNANWNVKQNWLGNVIPANDGTANLTFGAPGVSGTGLMPNIVRDWSVNSLTFSTLDTASYTLRSSGGYTLTIQGGGISNLGPSTHSISNTVALGANQTWQAVLGATLNIKGAVLNNGHDLTVSGSGDVAVEGTISGTGGLVKEGLGNLLLSGANTYSGGTIVNSGTLAVNNVIGSATGIGDVTIGSAGLLTGSGIITGPVGLSGLIAPGHNIGSLTTGGQTWNASAGLRWQISDATGLPGSGWDLVSVNGGLNITATPANSFTIHAGSLTPVFTAGLAANFDPNASYSWLILTTTSGISGFDPNAFTVDLAGFVNPLAGSFNAVNIGNDLFLNYTPVPEPALCSLVGLSLLLFTLLKRKRRS